jgi:hypothetical protein
MTDNCRLEEKDEFQSIYSLVEKNKMKLEILIINI